MEKIRKRLAISRSKMTNRTRVAVRTGRNEPVVRRLGTRRGSLGISVLAEPCTPSRNCTSQAPGSIEYRFN